MKKLFTLAVVAATMMFSQTANAQVQFGVKAGVNLSSISMSHDEDAIDASNRTGFFAGATAVFQLPVVGLGVDGSILYDQREAKLKISKISNPDISATPSDESLKLQQIAVPINIRYGFGLGSLASAFVFAGPQFGFNVGDKKTEVVKNLVAWETESTNFSLNFGVGVMALNHLQVTANYNLALGKTSELSFKNVYNEAFHPEVKASSWQIGVAYLF